MPKPEPIGDKRAKAHPTKAFFVRMLTRDISLEDCILDLVDNSVDAAWSRSGATPTSLETSQALAKFKISLTIDKSRFDIVDNCGGISLNDAAEYAFTFGRDEIGGGPDEYAIGVYGIGMKRAVFKLGSTVWIRSTHTGDEPFVVPIDVPAWLADKSSAWDFDIDEAEPLPEPGVSIAVSDLNAETITTFTDPGFLRTLRKTVARDYMLPLMHGLQIEINGQKVDGWEPAFRVGNDFEPMRERYQDGDVAVEVIAGMVSAPPNSTEPSQRPKDDRSGWYVICNGRVVVTADRSQTTVWGRDGFPGWHGQYEGFVGIVLFSSRDPKLLPMTTTKNGVDSSSPLYRRAVAKMFPSTRQWIDYTNARKAMREESREKESATSALPISQVKVRHSLKLPAKVEGAKEANVLYVVPLDRMKALAKAFGRSTMSYREVGTRSFDFAYSKLVDAS
jgi:hypothetical protein